MVAALVALLLSLPGLARLLPSDAASTLSAAQLLDRVRAGDRVPWSGYAEVRGDLDLPDVRELSALPATIGETTRLRTWWRGAQEWRADSMTVTGELDVVQGRSRDGRLPRRITWDSGERNADVRIGQQSIRLPVGADLLPNALGARLARAEGIVPTLLPDRRVAGRPAVGLRLTAADLATTTVEHVDVWSEPTTGLPLRVEVTAVGAERPSVTALVLDLDLSVPPLERTRFVLPPGATVTRDAAPDLAAIADREARLLLPGSLVGLPRDDRVQGLGGGVATYGAGYTALTVVPLSPGTAGDVLRRLRRAQPSAVRPGATAAVGTPLVQVLLAVRGDRGYLLAGTVPESLLQQALRALEADPPPPREGVR